MKKYILIFLIIFKITLASTQTDYQPVIKLLLDNNREEARRLFDKKFLKIKDSNIELLLLDVLLDVEMGQTQFDETFLRKIEKFPESKHYVTALMLNKYVLGDVNQDGFDDLTLKKIDYLIESPVYNDILYAKYIAAIIAQRKRKVEQFNSLIGQLNSINSWQRCGTFENLNGSGFQTEYGPETYSKNDTLFDANSNGKLSWFNPVQHKDEGYMVFHNEKEYGSGIVYAQTFIEVPETQIYRFRLGASSSIKFFLNDEEIIVKDDIQENNLDAFVFEIELPKGVNRLLAKLDASKSINYFSAGFLKTDGTKALELKYYDTHKDYNPKKMVNIIEIEPPTETYFKNLLQSDPDNFLYRYLLFNAYMTNAKKTLAHDVIDDWEEKYSQSSIISILSIFYHSINEDNNKVQQILKNMEQNDPSYYNNSFVKISDSQWVQNASSSEIDRYHKYCKNYKSSACNLLFNMLKASKESNIDQMLSLYDEIFETFNRPSKLVTIQADMYKLLKNDRDTYYAKLKSYHDNYYDINVAQNLIEHYNQLNEKEKVKEILLQNIELNPNSNYARTALIDEYIKDNDFDKALQLINVNLDYYPFSFQNLEKKADVLNLKKDKKGAEKYLKQALIYNSTDTRLRKKLYEILKIDDEIEVVETKDIYDLIRNNRNTKLQGDEGVTLLLDEQLINIYPEGGSKTKLTFLYEITNESGIENLKEYSFNSYNVNLTKSEIVKPNGTIVPAEDSGSMLVFTNLAVGDVIYISYDYTNSNYGRFFKDFNFNYQFNGGYPCVNSILKIIYPENISFNTAYVNGQPTTKESKVGSKKIKEWQVENSPQIPISEPYSPVYRDLVNTIHIGSISGWKEIANWYADLVKKSTKEDKISEKAFNEIFPQGVQGLSDYQKAYEIYKYIGQNISYSFLDFRQSGHIPQKPSKTLSTKLGDCKDLSTLFVVLGAKAGLNANLVLVLTNDNGNQQLPLPSQEFNHCIVRIMIENKAYYLEMTNNFLPFMALPNTLYQALALNIHFDKSKNENADLFNIPFDNTLKSTYLSNTTVNVSDTEKELVTKFSFNGNNKTYFNELFSDRISDEVRKKELENFLNVNLSSSVNLQSYELITSERFSDNITFNVSYKIKEKPKKLGSLKMLYIPFILKPFNKNIVSLESRNFDIHYPFYENSNSYDSELILKIDDDQKFVEIPEDKSFNYKGKTYQLNYELISPNALKIRRTSFLEWHNIPKEEYVDFKEFVDKILDSEQEVIGYK